MLKLARLFATASGVVMCLARPAHAQSVLGDPVPLGVREGAGLLDELLERPVGFRPRTHQILVTPSYLSAEGTTMYGGTLGYVSRGAIHVWPFQVRVSAKNVEVVSRSHFRYGGDLKVTLFPKQKIVKASARAAFQKTVSVATRQDYVLALERVCLRSQGNTVSIGASTAYLVSHPAAGGSVTAGKVAFGSTLSFGTTTEVSLDYSFKNDVEGADDFSFTLAQTLSGFSFNPTLALAAGKHRVVALNLVLAF